MLEAGVLPGAREVTQAQTSEQVAKAVSEQICHGGQEAEESPEKEQRGS